MRNIRNIVLSNCSTMLLSIPDRMRKKITALSPGSMKIKVVAQLKRKYSAGLRFHRHLHKSVFSVFSLIILEVVLSAYLLVPTTNNTFKGVVSGALVTKMVI